MALAQAGEPIVRCQRHLVSLTWRPGRCGLGGMSRGWGSYEAENRRRLERERAAARARADAAERRLEAASIASAALGRKAVQKAKREKGRVGAPPGAAATTAELTRWVNEADRVASRMERDAAKAREAERAADLARHLEARAASSGQRPENAARRGRAGAPSAEGQSTKRGPRVGTGPDASRADGAAGDAHGPAEPGGPVAHRTVKELATDIERVVAELDPDATPDERKRVERLAQEIVTGGPDSGGERVTWAHPETLLVQLKSEVQAISRAADARRAENERAAELLRSLDGIDGAELRADVEDLRVLLKRVLSGGTTLATTDEARVADLKARATAAEDREYVAEQLTVAFSALGYDVTSAGVRESLVAGEAAYAYVAGSPDHAVELQLTTGAYAFRMVRGTAGGDSAEDVALEAKLCKDVGKATARIGRAGVRCSLDSHHAAGTAPLAVVPAIAERRKTGRGEKVAPKTHERRL